MLTLLLSTAVCCALVVLTPGPGVFTVLHIGSAGGRPAAAQFLLGHLTGDLMWALLALVTLRSVRFLPPAVPVALSVLSALYMCYLGTRALMAAAAQGGPVASYLRRPLSHGAIFGVTNPKSYPVTLAIFSAVLAGRVEMVTPATVPLFLFVNAVGCLTADAVLVWIVGLVAIRRLYHLSARWITRGVDIIFLGFAAYTSLHLM